MQTAFADPIYSFTTIDVPGQSTRAWGINDSGQIVGYFDDTTGEHGFLATPVPEPPSSLTLATGLVALYAMTGPPQTHQCQETSTSVIFEFLQVWDPMSRSYSGTPFRIPLVVLPCRA